MHFAFALSFPEFDAASEKRVECQQYRASPFPLPSSQKTAA